MLRIWYGFSQVGLLVADEAGVFKVGGWVTISLEVGAFEASVGDLGSESLA